MTGRSDRSGAARRRRTLSYRASATRNNRVEKEISFFNFHPAASISYTYLPRNRFDFISCVCRSLIYVFIVSTAPGSPFQVEFRNLLCGGSSESIAYGRYDVQRTTLGRSRNRKTTLWPQYRARHVYWINARTLTPLAVTSSHLMSRSVLCTPHSALCTRIIYYCLYVHALFIALSHVCPLAPLFPT